jgi:peptidoglycan/xylan/chitin deacetylase (PgdA/CDA1 family)
VRAAISGFRRARPTGVRVVLYHHLADRPSDLVDRLNVSTPPALFEAHLRRFVRDYEIVDLDQVLSGRLPRRALLITFDDGYRSVLDVAGPLLKRHGLPSVFFLSAAFILPGSLPLDNLLCWLSHRVTPAELESEVTGRPARRPSFAGLMASLAGLPYERRARLGDDLAERFGVDRARLRADSGLFLGRDELPRLSDFEVEAGNHTRSHLHCRAIVDDATGQLELVEHRRQLAEWTGAAIRSFSYPYGSGQDATPLVERMLVASGHQATFLVESLPNPPHRPGAPWHRVSLRDKPLSRLSLELETLPRLRAVRNRLR